MLYDVYASISFDKSDQNFQGLIHIYSRYLLKFVFTNSNS